MGVQKAPSAPFSAPLPSPTSHSLPAPQPQNVDVDVDLEEDTLPKLGLVIGGVQRHKSAWLLSGRLLHPHFWRKVKNDEEHEEHEEHEEEGPDPADIVPLIPDFTWVMPPGAVVPPPWDIPYFRNGGEGDGDGEGEGDGGAGDGEYGNAGGDGDGDGDGDGGAGDSGGAGKYEKYDEDEVDSSTPNSSPFSASGFWDRSPSSSHSSASSFEVIDLEVEFYYSVSDEEDGGVGTLIAINDDEVHDAEDREASMPRAAMIPNGALYPIPDGYAGMNGYHVQQTSLPSSTTLPSSPSLIRLESPTPLDLLRGTPTPTLLVPTASSENHNTLLLDLEIREEGMTNMFSPSPNPKFNPPPNGYVRKRSRRRKAQGIVHVPPAAPPPLASASPLAPPPPAPSAQPVNGTTRAQESTLRAAGVTYPVRAPLTGTAPRRPSTNHTGWRAPNGHWRPQHQQQQQDHRSLPPLLFLSRPSVPDTPNYASLTEFASRGGLFRVHDTTCIAKFVPGDGSESGFSAPEFIHLSASTYPEDAPWKGHAGSFLATRVSTHVRGEPNNVPNPWISATSNLDWAVWSVVRGLSRGLGRVEIALLSPMHEHRARPDFALRECAPGARGAIMAATAAGEVLFYGRVFAGSVLANTVWTLEVS